MPYYMAIGYTIKQLPFKKFPKRSNDRFGLKVVVSMSRNRTAAGILIAAGMFGRCDIPFCLPYFV